MKGSREQWMCLLIAAQRWGGAGVGRGHLLSLENSPHGLQHIDHRNPDGLCFSFQCLVTCGKGHKHRQVWCQFGEDRLSDRMCDPEAKPEPMQTCQQPECAAWQAGPWGQCSVTCGQGYQLRAVKCTMGTYMSVVDDNDCNAATRPTDTQVSLLFQLRYWLWAVKGQKLTSSDKTKTFP